MKIDGRWVDKPRFWLFERDALMALGKPSGAPVGPERKGPARQPNARRRAGD